jgi:hypothetical protein
MLAITAMSSDPNQSRDAEPAKPAQPAKSTFGLPARLELAIKIVGAVIALAGFAWGVYTYQVTATRQASKPFYDKQLELYFQTANAAATLATDPRPDHWHKARREFWQLYWGPLSMVEDVVPYSPTTRSQEEPKTVEAAMILFGETLAAIEKTLSASDAPPDQELLDSLKNPALWLAHRLRDSLRASWPVKGDLGSRSGG